MQQEQTSYSIAELSGEFAVTARAIRFYEDEGLLHPGRQGQTRVFSPADRTRLAWILRGKRVGFTLAEIAEMLDLYNRDDDRRLQQQVTLRKCRQRLQMLEQQRDDIDETINELSEFCQKIEELLEPKQDELPA